jgi:peptidoglycan-associated lipoprotein
MSKRRLLIPLLALVVSVAGVTGCKKKPPAEPTEPAPAPAAEPAPEPPPPPPPPPAPEPKPAPPQRPSLATLNSELRPIHFDFDKSAIRGDAIPVLDGNAALMAKYPEFNIVVEGHCDERGTIEYNLALGDRRATMAKKSLVERGVAPGRISTISYGEERPVDPGHNEAAWAKNRRAAFRFVQR